MITLHILQLLADNGFGTIDTDLFWEEIPLDEKGEVKDGIWILSRGAPLTRGTRNIEAFDIYSRYANKVTGSQKLEDILSFLGGAYGTICDLPEVSGHSNNEYKKVAIQPTSNIENAGVDANGKVVRVISGQIIYNK